jgi:hypothetical protein
VRLLGGSFAFFCRGLCVEKNANVPPNALAFSLHLKLLKNIFRNELQGQNNGRSFAYYN